jgi:hypothetical protein
VLGFLAVHDEPRHLALAARAALDDGVHDEGDLRLLVGKLGDEPVEVGAHAADAVGRGEPVALGAVAGESSGARPAGRR